MEAALGMSSDRLAELYSRHAPGGGRLAYLMTGDRALSEDLVQEAFVKVMTRFGDLRKPDSFDSYLKRTVINLIKGHYRHTQVERSYLRRIVREPEPVVEAGTGEGNDMWARIAALPTRQRAAVVLRFYEDLSEQQTADVLGCSPAAAKSLIARAMQVLRAQEVEEV